MKNRTRKQIINNLRNSKYGYIFITNAEMKKLYNGQISTMFYVTEKEGKILTNERIFKTKKVIAKLDGSELTIKADSELYSFTLKEDNRKLCYFMLPSSRGMTAYAITEIEQDDKSVLLILPQDDCIQFDENYPHYYVNRYGKIFSDFYNHGHGTKPYCATPLASDYSNGYERVRCKNADGTTHAIRTHRAVAKAFIPNPNNLPEVNHKDENKSNNCIDNLEWVTRRENMHYGTALQRSRETRRKNNEAKKAKVTISSQQSKGQE